MKSKVGVALLSILVFLLGGIVGAISHYFYHERFVHAAFFKNPPPPPLDVVEGMGQYLNLDAQQKQKLRVIFDESLERYRTLGKQFRPLYDTIRNETEDQIMLILRPDQRKKYQDFLDRFSPPRPKQKEQPESK